MNYEISSAVNCQSTTTTTPMYGASLGNLNIGDMQLVCYCCCCAPNEHPLFIAEQME